MVSLQEITHQAAQAAEILLDAARPQPGGICVVGCSTSEIAGEMIGSASNLEVAQAVWEGLAPAIQAAKLYLAVQGCEHINRALCVSRACAERFDLTEVMVVPWLHAGGAFATYAYGRTADAVMVEDLRARAVLGLDIGGTLIGMHLRPVAVPVHSPLRQIGAAHLTMARVRPRYIGGPRAKYRPE